MMIRLFPLLATLCLLLMPNAGTAKTDAQQRTQKAKPAVSDTTTTPVLWEKTEWGELGVGQFIHAPFPDDSRTTGYTHNNKDYPFDPHYNDPSAAFAIPAGFDSKGSIDFVVICHGHINAARRFIVENKMGEILHRTQRNAILIAPQGPKNVPDSSGGKFEKPGEFALFMNEVLQVLKREGRIDSQATMGNVIVSGLSGGGRPLGNILGIGGLDNHIKEAWIIDAAYEQHDNLTKHFASSLTTTGPQVLRSLFTDHLATDNADLMARIGTPNGRPICVVDDGLMTDYKTELPKLMRQHQILFMHTLLPHDAYKMTERYLEPLIKSSGYLRDIPGVK